MSENCIRILKAITSEATKLSPGAVLKLQSTSPPIIRLLCERFTEDSNCLEGDIDALFLLKGIGVEDDPWDEFLR